MSQAWTPCRGHASFHVQSVAREWAVTAFSETDASTECTGNAEGSSAWQRTLITDVLSARELHAAWTVDHRGKYKSNLSSCRWYLPFATWETCSQQLMAATFNHNTYENPLEEVQGAATSSLFQPPLFQNTWPHVQVLCAECNAPCQ